MIDTKLRRKTQAQRRAQSRQAVLDSAVRLFGERGYANTSLEEIAADCGLTIRPIYHYFGNKKALFAAVNEQMEARILATMNAPADSGRDADFLANWRAYLDLCDDPGFCRIVLVDSPNILGRERWVTSPVAEKARLLLASAEQGEEGSPFSSALVGRVIVAATTEAALMVAQAEDVPRAKEEAISLIATLFAVLTRQ